MLYMKSLTQKYPDRDWSYFISSFKNELDFMNAESGDKYLEDFKQRTNRLDQIRGEDFREVFPELRSILD